MCFIFSLERLAQKIYTLSCFCLDLIFLLRPTRSQTKSKDQKIRAVFLLLGRLKKPTHQKFNYYNVFYTHAFVLSLNRLNLRLLPVSNSTASNETTTLLALDTAAHANVLIKDEAPDGVAPALVTGQGVVKLVSNVSHSVETGPGDGGEVMVLVVKTDVVGEPVERSVVRKGLGNGDLVLGVASGGRDGLVDVVLCNEVAGQGVQTSCEEGREQKVEQRVDGGVLEENQIKGYLNDNVEEVDLSQGDAVDGHGSQGVEEDLESAEERLSENRVEEDCLESSGEIGIEAINAEGLVVSKMVRLKRTKG